MNVATDSPGVTVATFHERPTAEVFRDYLERKGMEANVQDERKLQRFWFLARPAAGVHVRVPREELGLGQELLGEWEATVPKAYRSIHCPSCGSSRVQYPQMTRKFILPTVVAQVGVRLGFLSPEYYCEDCHETWTRFSADARAAQRTSPRDSGEGVA